MSIASISFVTLGCAKNEVDSARMKRNLRSAGFAICDDPATCDVVIVNTCCFIQAATEESIEAIFNATEAENVLSGDTQVVVAGCMPARYGQDLESELSEVKSFIPCSKEDDIVELMSAILPEDKLPSFPDNASLVPEAAIAPDFAGETAHCAYVKISDGCDRMCSYCTIPSIRGRYHSFTYEDIRSEVALCVESGIKEITLIAQDTGRWGRDFSPRSSLAWLMDQLAEEFSETWFRVMYIQPEGITDELLSVIAKHDNICSYLDLPLQHVDPEVLRAMNRKGSADQFLELIEHIRTMIPGVTLRTTFIAGFPGETDQDFDQLLDFVSEACFDYVGVFPYSQEDGTKAAELPGQIDEDLKVARAQELRDMADSVSATVVASRVGTECPVLVLGEEEDGQLFGRTQSQAPDVDGSTFVDAGEPGSIVNARIVDTMFYEMEAEVMGDVVDPE